MFLSVSPRLRLSFLICLGLLAAQFIGLFYFRHNTTAGWLADLLFLMLFRALVVAADFWRAWRAISLSRHWILVGLGTLLAVFGLVLNGWLLWRPSALHAASSTVADYTDLFAVLSYAPYLLLVSLPSGKELPKTFYWLDALQTIVLSYLVYLKLFAVVPFTHTQSHPVPAETVTVFFYIMTFSLAALFILRFLGAVTPDERGFYRIASITSVIAVVTFAFIGVMTKGSETATYYELLSSFPVVVSLLLILSLPKETPEGAMAIADPGRIAEVLNIICPAFLTLSMMALGMDAVRHFPRFGLWVIAVAFILHLVRSTILQRNVERSERSLKEARNKLEDMALTDALTGVANRRYFDRTFQAEWNRAVRTRSPLALLIMDIDFFKHLNDRYGHQAGDECLAQVAKALQSCLPRSGDLVARYGGEEFCVILPSTDVEGARIVAAKMQDAVRDLAIENETPIGLHATISIGVAVATFPTDSSAHQLFETADRALYLAKENGRDRVEMAPSPKLVISPKKA